MIYCSYVSAMATFQTGLGDLMLCRGRKPVDVALEFKQRGFLEMLAAFISPPPPREQRHFDAILRLAVFFEELSGVTEVA